LGASVYMRRQIRLQERGKRGEVPKTCQIGRKGLSRKTQQAVGIKTGGNPHQDLPADRSLQEAKGGKKWEKDKKEKRTRYGGGHLWATANLGKKNNLQLKEKKVDWERRLKGRRRERHEGKNS